MKARNKRKEDKLISPSLLKRVRPTILYNVILTLIWIPLFPLLYTIDDVVYELDYFMMNGLYSPRWQIVPVIITFYMFLRQIAKDINLIIDIKKSADHDKDVILFGGHKRVFDGVEGVGKTLNATNDAVILACDKDEKMRFEYYLKKPYEDVLKDDPHYNALCYSYNFYKDNPDKIPHLMSKYPITYNGKTSYVFDMAYFDQEKRLAEGFVMALSELAEIFPNSWSKIPKDESQDPHKVIKKNETLSKSRQWFDLTVVSDEQRMGEVFIGFRSVTGLGRSLVSRKRVLEPKFLKLIERRLHSKIMKKKEQTSKFLSWCYTLVNKIQSKIGFYVFTYVDREVLTGKGKTEEKSFYLPCNFLFSYDTRYEREKYPLYGAMPE